LAPGPAHACERPHEIPSCGRVATAVVTPPSQGKNLFATQTPAAPYGVYDFAGNVGWVSVGIDHDTAAFAVNAIRSWWARYPNAC
jgi:Rhodopirellula transposase DDE domain